MTPQARTLVTLARLSKTTFWLQHKRPSTLTPLSTLACCMLAPLRHPYLRPTKVTALLPTLLVPSHLLQAASHAPALQHAPSLAAQRPSHGNVIFNATSAVPYTTALRQDVLAKEWELSPAKINLMNIWCGSTDWLFRRDSVGENKGRSRIFCLHREFRKRGD